MSTITAVITLLSVILLIIGLFILILLRIYRSTIKIQKEIYKVQIFITQVDIRDRVTRLGILLYLNDYMIDAQQYEYVKIIRRYIDDLLSEIKEDMESK